MFRRMGWCIVTAALLAGCGRGAALPEQNSTLAGPTKALTALVSTAPASPVVVAAPATLEKPVEAEKNPAGDIPDNQVFVKYASQAGGYELQVPEGWARTTTEADVSFVDKLDGVMVTVDPATTPPSVESIKAHQVAALQKSGRAVKVKDVQQVELGNGPAVRVAYDSNSDPNPVTNKQVRLENESYYFYKDSHLTTLTVWAPLGADNVDQWKLIVNSFKWR